MNIGDKVRVTGPLTWADGSPCNESFFVGRVGEVEGLDDDGDLLIDFDGEGGFIAETSLTLVTGEVQPIAQDLLLMAEKHEAAALALREAAEKVKEALA